MAFVDPRRVGNLKSSAIIGHAAGVGWLIGSAARIPHDPLRQRVIDELQAKIDASRAPKLSPAERRKRGLEALSRMANAARSMGIRPKPYAIRLHGEVGDQMAERVKRQCENAMALRSSGIELSIETKGGECRAADQIIDRLRATKLPVTAHTDWLCASAGAVIFMHASTRTAGRDAFLMVHPSWMDLPAQVQWAAQHKGGGATHLEAMAKRLRENDDRFRQVMLAKTNIPAWAVDGDRDVWISADEGRLVDMVTRITGPSDPSKLLPEIKAVRAEPWFKRETDRPCWRAPWQETAA
jgi:ATP-dependent protease ClpP protease subunit